MYFFNAAEWNEFTYGKTCRRDIHRARDIRSRSSRASNSYKIRLSGLVIAALATYAGSIPTRHINQNNPAFRKISGFQDVSGKLGFRISEARLSLGLTQSELSSLLGLSLSTLQKVELGETQTPRKEGLQNFYLFLELDQYLSRVTKNRKFYKRSIMRTPISSLGNLTPIEYVKAVESDGLNSLISTFKRIYG